MDGHVSHCNICKALLPATATAAAEGKERAPKLPNPPNLTLAPYSQCAQPQTLSTVAAPDPYALHHLTHLERVQQAQEFAAEGAPLLRP